MRAIEWRRPSRETLVSGALVAIGLVLLASDGALVDLLEGADPVDLVQIAVAAVFLGAAAWAIRRRHKLELRMQVLELQERLIHDASHELRAPVTIARGHLELLLDAQATPEVDVALDELSRVERVVQRLLLLAKARTPDFVVAGELALDEFLEDVFLRWSATAARAWRLGPVPAGTLRADAGAVRAALDALLENAVRHTQRHDSIELRAHAYGGEVVIEVADRGGGIEPDQLERIFQRFVRGENGHPGEGLGLGLAIVEALAKAHGGGCSARSEGGETVFALRLPRFRPARVEAQVPAAGKLLADG